MSDFLGRADDRDAGGEEAPGFADLASGVSLTIRTIRVRTVELVPATPVETAAGALSTTPLVLIDMFTEEGPVGRSYLRCYAPVALRPLALLVSGLNEVVRGQTVDPTALDARLGATFRLLGCRGLAGMALAGLDMAAWDLVAKAAAKPLWRLLGGSGDSLPAYVGIRSMSAQGAAREAAEAVGRGARMLKLKIGRGDLAEDMAVIGAVRARASDAGLMVDYNQSLSVDEALRRMPVLDREGLVWIEEPTVAGDLSGAARIAEAARTPIQLGENAEGVSDLARSIAAAASDYLMFDAMKIGGVSGWLRAARLAARHGLPVSSHAFPEISAHLLSATPGAHWLEAVDHLGDLVRAPFGLCGNRYTLTTDPGAGLEWNEDVLRKAGAELVR